MTAWHQLREALSSTSLQFCAGNTSIVLEDRHSRAMLLAFRDVGGLAEEPALARGEVRPDLDHGAVAHGQGQRAVGGAVEQRPPPALAAGQGVQTGPGGPHGTRVLTGRWPPNALAAEEVSRGRVEEALLVVVAVPADGGPKAASGSREGPALWRAHGRILGRDHDGGRHVAFEERGVALGMSKVHRRCPQLLIEAVIRGCKGRRLCLACYP
mmetsp:Transcript_120752/g.352659  ORF Transcript_120752/g.352659 Transcript_120752/m.352659 type:complete len:212 (-) Transcript_120752:159-794(-)